MGDAHNPPIYLIGEDNPYGTDPRYDLYPSPERSAGGRLCHKVLGIRMLDYLNPKIFARYNLCCFKWDAATAEMRAKQIYDQASNAGRDILIVMLGRKVTEAFKSPCKDFEAQGSLYDRVCLLRLPHPSGRNRAWNESGAFEKAKATVAKLSPEYAALRRVDAL